MKEYYGTLFQNNKWFEKKGYTPDFNLGGECIICNQKNTVLSADDFEIDKIYRFEGESNPSDESIRYAISSNKT
jgi:ribosomal protein L13